MPPTFYNLLSLYCASTAYWGCASMASMAARAPQIVPCTKVRGYPSLGPHGIQRRADRS